MKEHTNKRGSQKEKMPMGKNTKGTIKMQKLIKNTKTKKENLKNYLMEKAKVRSSK